MWHFSLSCENIHSEKIRVSEGNCINWAKPKLQRENTDHSVTTYSYLKGHSNSKGGDTFERQIKQHLVKLSAAEAEIS